MDTRSKTRDAPWSGEIATYHHVYQLHLTQPQPTRPPTLHRHASHVVGRNRDLSPREVRLCSHTQNTGTSSRGTSHAHNARYSPCYSFALPYLTFTQRRALLGSAVSPPPLTHTSHDETHANSPRVSWPSSPHLFLPNHQPGAPKAPLTLNHPTPNRHHPT